MAPRGKRSGWAVVGALLLVVGLAAAALAAYGRVEGDDVRPVGILVGSNLDGFDAESADDPPSGGTSAPAPTSAPSDDPQWPAEFQGRPPAFGTDGSPPPAEAGDLAEGFYLWSDFEGFHVWLVGDPDGTATLEVITDDDMTATATGGSPDLTVDEDRFQFSRGSEPAEVVGVDFNPGFFVDQLEVTVTGDVAVFTGTAASPAQPPLTLRYEPQG